MNSDGSGKEAIRLALKCIAEPYPKLGRGVLVTCCPPSSLKSKLPFLILALSHGDVKMLIIVGK